MFAILAYYDGNENHFEQVIIPDGVTAQWFAKQKHLLNEQTIHEVDQVNGLILTPDVDNTQIINDLGEVVYGELD